MKSKISCYLHKPSWLLEGNLNTCSIYEELIKYFDQFFNLNFKYNYSFNSSSSNMKIEQLPCLYYEGKRKKREEIYFFFEEALSYDKLPLCPDDNTILKAEAIILRNIILYDFQELIDYISYQKKQSVFGNIVRLMYQPIKKINGMVTDREIIQYIEHKYKISNKKQAFKYISEIDKKIDDYLSHIINDKSFSIKKMNPFLILIYSCIRTQKKILKFSESKMKKYNLYDFSNIREFENQINLDPELKIKAVFEPQNSFKDLEGDGNEGKESNDESFWKSKKFILQALGYSTVFTFLYYLKKKVI